MTQEDLIMDPPQLSFVWLKKRATIHGHELGTLSLPPTILRDLRMLGYNRERRPQSLETKEIIPKIRDLVSNATI